MPVFIIHTEQRQIAYNEYRVDAATEEIAKGRVSAGTESGEQYNTEYETEIIMECTTEEEEESATEVTK